MIFELEPLCENVIILVTLRTSDDSVAHGLQFLCGWWQTD